MALGAGEYMLGGITAFRDTVMPQVAQPRPEGCTAMVALGLVTTVIISNGGVYPVGNQRPSASCRRKVSQHGLDLSQKTPDLLNTLAR